MDFDSIFPLLILLLFFLLPSLIKQIKLADKNPQKNTIFSKIGNQIHLFIKEIEHQRQQQEQQQRANTPSSDIWETLAQEDNYLPVQEKEQLINESEFIKPVQEEKWADSFNEFEKTKPAPIADKIDKIDKTVKQAPCITIGSYKSNQLQNAVIWSEVLGKPVAL